MGRGMSRFPTITVIQIDSVNHRQMMPQLQTQQQPAFQSALQFGATRFYRLALRPQTFALGNRAENATILHQFIMRAVHGVLDIFGQPEINLAEQF